MTSAHAHMLQGRAPMSATRFSEPFKRFGSFVNFTSPGLSVRLCSNTDDIIMAVTVWKVLFIHLTVITGVYCSLQSDVSPEDSADIPAIAKYFCTKGRYEEVNPHLVKDILAVNRSLLQPPSASCRELHLTAVVRHGTRYPTSKNVKKMRKFHDLVRSEARGEQGWLRELQTRWRMWYTVDMDGRLVQKGVEDLKHLAVRLSKLFPSLVSEEKLRGGLFKFITSSKHRCVNSTLSFKAGLTELWGIEGKMEENKSDSGRFV